MADAKKVIEIVEDEIRLLSKTSGTEEQITPLRELVAKARASKDGTVPDKEVRESALHPSQVRKLIG